MASARPLALLVQLFFLAVAGSSGPRQALRERRRREILHVAENLGPRRLLAETLKVPSRLDRFLEASMRPKASDVTADAKDVSTAYAYVADATSSSPQWDLKVEKGKLRVWRRSLPGSRVDEVRGNGILDASPSAVVGLLRENDADVIRSYNPLYDSGHDVCRVDGRTRLSYARVRSFFPLKPRDTLTRVAQWELPLLGSGATALLLQHATHPDAPALPNVVRAKILRGMHLVQPVRGSPGKANFTFCQQVDAGGVVPAFVMNIVTTQDSIQFMNRLEKAAKKRRGKKKPPPPQQPKPPKA